MIELNGKNYFSLDAGKDYWSVSQFKAFDKCEAAGLATVRGEYERETTSSLLVGSYVDEYFTGDLGRFQTEHPEIFKRDGTLKSEYQQAEKMIARVEREPLMMEYLTGEKQVIMSAELFDVPWKIKIDVHGGNKIIDLKTVKDFGNVYRDGYGYMSWVEAWGYDIQGAVYQKIEQIHSGRVEPLPFYLVAVSKERHPDVAVLKIPQHYLDAALKIVEAKIERFDLIKHGEVPPMRCEHCDYCHDSKKLTAPTEYAMEEDI